MPVYPTPPNFWSAHQLTEFVASVAEQSDLRHAVDRALDELRATFDCEVAAISQADELLGWIGFGAQRPEDFVAQIIDGSLSEVSIPGAGVCHMAVVRHGSEDDSDCVLVVGRVDPPITPDEVGLLRSMSGVLGMSLTTFRLADSLRERQSLLERLAAIQRSIARRSDVNDVLESIVAGAVDLLGANAAFIRLRDTADPSVQRIVVSRGLHQDLVRPSREIGTNEGISGRVSMSRGVAVETIGAGGTIDPALPPDHALVIAAPIHNAGTTVGAIIAAFSDSPRRGRIDDRRGSLSLFAEHASMALTDADAVQAMKLAMRDPVTQLPNRLAFRDRLNRAQTEIPDGTLSAVLFIDLDGFKEVNDSFGHAAGDRVLASVADHLTRYVRPGDLVARHGGDEFTILLRRIDGQREAESVAMRILEGLREPFLVNQTRVTITASIGIALEDADHQADMVECADRAMYIAKQRGGAGFETYISAARSGPARRPSDPG